MIDAADAHATLALAAATALSATYGPGITARAERLQWAPVLSPARKAVLADIAADPDPQNRKDTHALLRRGAEKIGRSGT
jgi:hypothetical protein